jgi:putative heme-binding domain-containing protein
VAHHGDDFLLANNAQWIGFSMEVGPAGDLFVLDWHDADICGKEVMNKETGRIFRIAPLNPLTKSWTGRYDDLKPKSDMELASLQTSVSDWHARRARTILQGRAARGPLDKSAVEQLRKTFLDNNNTDHRLRAMWALHITQSINAGELSSALSDKNEYVRAWAIQMLCEDMNPPAGAVDKMVSMSRSDASPVVRLYLAAAIQRVGTEAQWKITEGLMSRDSDVNDHNIPRMIWYGLEHLVREDPDKAIQLAGASRVPLVAEFTARRLVDANALERLVAEIAKKPQQLNALLSGMAAGLEGRSDAVAPTNWEKVYASLKNDSRVGRVALEIAQHFGDREAAMKLLQTLQDDKASVASRKDALNGLASRQREELEPILPSLMDDAGLRVDVIRAMASFDNAPFGELLISRFYKFSPQEQGEALQTLSSRPSYGRLLTQAIKSNTIRKNDVPAYVARQLRRVVGNGFVEVWGPIDQLAGDKTTAYNRYQHLLTDKALAGADLINGKAIFQRTCSSCHMLYGEGGKIGPDITGSNRSNLAYLLNNLIEPSSEIQDDYRMVVITSRDGRTYSGNIIAENDRQLTLRVIGQDQLVINKSDIQSQETAAVSMMPEGLLQTLTDKQVIDLVGYLRTHEQIQ